MSLTHLSNMTSRRSAGDSQSLDGTWRAILDPYGIGHAALVAGYQNDAKPEHPGHRVEYDFDTSREIEVPGDWNTQYPELLYFEGSVWYRRIITVDADEDPSRRSFIYFGAANHTTRVYLDGEELATHVGGFGDFAVEVTGRLAAGDHSLVVMVNNRRERDRIPAMMSDWWNFGGLTRSVELVTTPASFLRDAWLTMAPDGRIVGGVTLDGTDAETVTVSLPDTDLSIAVDASPGEEARFVLADADAAQVAERWNPGAPVLHNVEYRATSDTVVDQVGFRTVRVDGTTIVVNDSPTFLKGISIHGEGPSGGRRAHGDADAKELLGWAVDLGANFVRLAHYQHDEAMVREADRRGLLAWTELPVYWGIDFGNEATLANGLDQADELVIRDRSRASVILWSAANETMASEDRNTFLTSIVKRFRELDSTRLVTAALFTMPSDDSQVHVEDELGEVIDVIGINQYFGWYYGSRESIADARYTSKFTKPIVFSEMGGGAKFGHHGSDEQIWTEEFQQAIYEQQIEMVKNQTECGGLSPWILKDFRTPMRTLPGIQDGYNRKGLVSEEGERKLAFGTLQSFYNSL